MPEPIYEFVKLLKKSEKSRVTLVKDTASQTLYIQKELNGPQYVYKKLLGQTWPYLPKIFQVSYKNGVTSVLEEYIDGVPIHQAGLSEKQLMRAFQELCETLSFLHKQKIIHKDIKPENILIARDGHIRLIDFDISRTQKEEAGHDTRILGTRGFAPPEQYGFAQTDARSDIYQAGITLKQLLGPLAKDRKYEKLIKKCTSLDPKNRFPSANSILRYIKSRKLKRIVVISPLFVLLFVVSYACVLALILYFGMQEEPLVKADIHAAIYGVLPEQSNIREYVFSETAPYMPYPPSQTAERLTPASDTQANSFSCQEAWQAISKDYNSYTYIYSGFMDDQNNYIFGAFTWYLNWENGGLCYEKFAGLILVNADTLETTAVAPGKCENYPMAMEALYEKPVFDSAAASLMETLTQ